MLHTHKSQVGNRLEVPAVVSQQWRVVADRRRADPEIIRVVVLTEWMPVTARLSLELSPQFGDLWVPRDYDVRPNSRFKLAQPLVTPVCAVGAKVDLGDRGESQNRYLVL